MEEQKKEKWHVGKEVPLTLVIGLIIQTVTVVTWLNDLKSEVKAASIRIEEIWRDRYTKEDARRDFDIVRGRVDDMRQGLTDHEARLRALEHPSRMTK